MSNVKSYTDKDIIDRVEGLSTFKGWKPGIYDIWIRSDEDQFDAFDDKAYTFEVDSDGVPRFVMVRAGTTNTGSYGLKRFKEYNDLGAAVLKSDWMVYGSHIFGNHPFKNGKPAYRQAKSWPHFRDGNRNNKAEEIGPEYDGIIGANIHRAGVNSTVIKNWSTACLVTANLNKFLSFLKFMKSKGNPPLTVAILKEWTPGAKLPAKSSAVDPSDKTTTTSDEQAAADTPSAVGGDTLSSSQDQPPIVQNADQIINTGDQSNTPAPEDKTLVAPTKDGATSTATKTTILGIAVPPTLYAVFSGISDWVEKGYIDAKEIGSTLFGLLRDNYKYVFILIGLIIVILIVKKVVKQITFWIQMITAAVPQWNTIKVVPTTTEPPSKWWQIWK